MTSEHAHSSSSGPAWPAPRPPRPSARRASTGACVLVGAEEERPYERPPLSKDYLRGEVGREKVYVHDEGFYAEHDIELRTGRAAERLDTERARADARRRRDGCATTGCC